MQAGNQIECIFRYYIPVSVSVSVPVSVSSLACILLVGNSRLQFRIIFLRNMYFCNTLLFSMIWCANIIKVLKNRQGSIIKYLSLLQYVSTHFSANSGPEPSEFYLFY